MTTTGEPRIVARPAQAYMGIRTSAPFKGMSKVVDKIARELDQWIERNQVATSGPPFLRYHVIDMRGSMDLTYGVPVRAALPNDGAVAADVLPDGRYACLVYRGNGIAGNRALIEWARANGMEFDRWDTEQGDNFRSRYETFLTDPRLEPRKTRWEIEVAIKLKDEHIRDAT